MRWLSHLELQSVMERALRRAELPLAFSRGFSPRPKVAFATALPVGLASEAEWADVELVERLEVSDFIQRLAEQLPEGLQIYEASEVSLNVASLMSSLQASTYAISNLKSQISNLKLEERITEVLAATELWVERKTKHGVKRINIRPLIHDLTLAVDPLTHSPVHPLTAVLADGSAGKGRPEEVARLVFGEDLDLVIVKTASSFNG